MFAKVPPVPALLGIGGSLKIDPPITSIALLPFVLMLAGSWVLSRRERTLVVLAIVAPVCYALILAVVALLFRVTSTGDGAEITVSASPLSAALHGLLVAGLGTLVGSVTAQGPFLPDRARQVLRGGLAAVGISVVLTLLLAMLPFAQTAFSEHPLEGLRHNGGSQPNENAQPEGSQPKGGGVGDTIGAVAGATGGAFALLPSVVGTLWRSPRLSPLALPLSACTSASVSPPPVVSRWCQTAPTSTMRQNSIPLNRLIYAEYGG